MLGLQAKGFAPGIARWKRLAGAVKHRPGSYLCSFEQQSVQGKRGTLRSGCDRIERVVAHGLLLCFCFDQRLLFLRNLI
jgi:hypothetical protein